MEQSKLRKVGCIGVLVVFFVSFFCFVAVPKVAGIWSSDYDFYSSYDFNVTVAEGKSLIFQMGDVARDDGYSYIGLYANSSDFNATACDLEYSDNSGGIFEFTVDNDVDVTVVFNYGETCPTLVNGAGQLEDGETVELVDGTTYYLRWLGFDVVLAAADIDVAVQAGVCCIVLFAPAVALVVLGVGKWGFIAGLTIGAVLGYSFLPLVGIGFPIWILVVIFIVDAGAFFAASRGNF